MWGILIISLLSLVPAVLVIVFRKAYWLRVLVVVTLT